MKTLWERALEEGKRVEEKKTGFQATVVRQDGELYLDEDISSPFLTPVEEFTEDDFFIVNE